MRAVEHVFKFPVIEWITRQPVMLLLDRRDLLQDVAVERAL
jgi:hypothetical protein